MYLIKEINQLEEVRFLLTMFNEYVYPNISMRVDSLEKYAEKLYTNAEVISIEINNEVLGFAAFYINDRNNRVAYISQIISKRKGFGSIILDYIVDKAISNQIKVIRLEVYKYNDIAIKFYKKHCFDLKKVNSDFLILERPIATVISEQ